MSEAGKVAAGFEWARRAARHLICLMLLPGMWMPFAACASQYQIDHWGTADGLPVNVIYRLHVARSGYLWLATADGLVRFDGHRFVIFDASEHAALSTNRIYDLLETPDGLLWLFVAPSTLVSYDGLSFRRYGIADGLLDALVWGIQLDETGQLWVFMGNGGIARRVDGHRFETVSEDLTPARRGFVGERPDDRHWITSAQG